MESARRLAVVTVTASRPHAAEYHSYSTRLIERAVSAAGGRGWQTSVVAAGDEGPAAALRLTDSADAVLVLGGEDIAPEYYGAARGYLGEGRHVEVADEAQLAVVQRAIGRRTPLLGVCRGHQIVNIALGGTLVQHLGESSVHRNERVPIHRVMSTHDVAVHAGTRLHGRLGDRAVTRSAHHQALGVLGSGLRVAAIAPDGVIEAVEHAELPILGVQWHPEAPGAVAGQLEALLATLEPAAARLSAAA